MKASGCTSASLPGYAASHGCIRMPSAAAEMFFNHVKVGTPVVVSRLVVAVLSRRFWESRSGWRFGHHEPPLSLSRSSQQVERGLVTSCLKVARSVGKKKWLTMVSPPPASAMKAVPDRLRLRSSARTGNAGGGQSKSGPGLLARPFRHRASNRLTNRSVFCQSRPEQRRGRQLSPRSHR